MRIRARITFLNVALTLAVVGSIVVNLIWVERRKVDAESDTRIQTMMEGVMRIARESLSSRDELMLMSYLMLLQAEHPEIEVALVSKAGHSSVIGKVRTELFYRTITVTEKNAAGFAETAAPVEKTALPPAKSLLPKDSLTIQLGFSKTLLDEQIHQAQMALVGKILGIAGIGLLFGLVGSFWVSGLIARPVSSIADAAEKFGEGQWDVAVPERGKDEVGDLGRRFNQMAGKIRESTMFKEDLLSTMTHELNTPLMGLESFLDFLRDDDHPQNPAERQEAYKTMSEAISQMKLSLGNALQLFKTGARIEISPERLCVNEIIDEVIRLFTPAAQSRDIGLRGPEGGAPVYLEADKELVRRMAINLISNALKYTLPGGHVAVGVAQTESQVKISVSDTGPGIAPEDRERIFEKFYRIPDSAGKKRRIPGSGLGLAIAKTAVELHRGKIWVESKLGVGSTFHISIPNGAK